MAIEPTMGERIADAAAEWSTTGDVSGWGSEAAISAWERLLTLCARADAAERLAVACLPHETDDDPADDQKAYEDSCQEWNEALAAWRALGEVQP